MTQEKLLDKLAKLRRHAESAKEIGNEAEATAFAEMFQKLVMEHKVNVSDIEFEQEVQEPVDRHYINYRDHGIPLKKRRIDWIESLASVVAQAHFCRILVTLGSSRITLVGRKSDCEVAEYVLVTLQRAAEKMAKKAYYKYWFELFEICSRCGGQKSNHSNESHDFTSSTYKAAGFKASWLESFVLRLAQRYREQKQGYEGNSVALVRVNRAEKAVIEWMENEFGDKKGAAALTGNRRWNQEGSRQGRAAADALDLGNPKAVKAGVNQKKLV